MTKYFKSLQTSHLPWIASGTALTIALLLSLSAFILQRNFDTREAASEFHFFTYPIFSDISFRYLLLCLLFLFILLFLHYRETVASKILFVTTTIIATIQYWFIVSDKFYYLKTDSEYFYWALITYCLDTIVIVFAIYGACSIPRANKTNN